MKRELICYASRTGTKRNLAALREAGWRLLVSRAGVWRTEGFDYAIDNGAWSDFQADRPFDEELFGAFADQFGPGADWIVVPDIVAGGRASLELSMRWLPRLEPLRRPLLIAVQDGMQPADLKGVVGPGVGIFLGGSTAWKLTTMQLWGEFANDNDAHYHVARVNTEKRFALAQAAGAHSVDGSSASRFAKTLPRLDRAARQPDLLSPRRAAA